MEVRRRIKQHVASKLPMVGQILKCMKINQSLATEPRGFICTILISNTRLPYFIGQAVVAYIIRWQMQNRVPANHTVRLVSNQGRPLWKITSAGSASTTTLTIARAAHGHRKHKNARKKHARAGASRHPAALRRVASVFGARVTRQRSNTEWPIEICCAPIRKPTNLFSLRPPEEIERRALHLQATL